MASIPLIVSSILSKKIAGGAETIVIDVKCGSGAFMTELAKARELANALTETGRLCGLNVHTEITDMSQPLGSAVGNALEVAEALRILRNQASTGPEKRFESLCLQLADRTLSAAGIEVKPEEVLRSGKALTKAEEWFKAQGATTMDPRPARLMETPIWADSDGYIAKIDAGAVGQAVLDMGGGRKKKDDAVDLQVGITILKLVGDPVSAGEPALVVHSRAPISPEAVEKLTSQILEVSPEAVAKPALFL